MVDSAKMPVLEFTSEMQGRPARVWVFRDRIEWNRRIGPTLLGRAVMATATGGASEELGGATGATGDGETETVPIDWVSSVRAQRVGMHVRLSIVARGSTIEMEVSRSKAARVQEVLRVLTAPRPPAGH